MCWNKKQTIRWLIYITNKQNSTVSNQTELCLHWCGDFHSKKPHLIARTAANVLARLLCHSITGLQPQGYKQLPAIVYLVAIAINVWRTKTLPKVDQIPKKSIGPQTETIVHFVLTL